MQRVDLQTELDSRVVLETSVVSLVRLQADSAPGRLLITGQLQTIKLCGKITLDVLHASARNLSLALTRHPWKGPCFPAEGTFVITGAVHALRAGIYNVVVEDRLVRDDGGIHVLDTIAVTTVEVR
jgi:hypothetical protein